MTRLDSVVPTGTPLDFARAEQMRIHACWGNRDSPHVHDVPAPDVLPVCYQVRTDALCLPFAYPCHSHEVEAFRTQKLPERKTLVWPSGWSAPCAPSAIARASWPEPIAASAPQLGLGTRTLGASQAAIEALSP